MSHEAFGTLAELASGIGVGVVGEADLGLSDQGGTVFLMDSLR